MKTELFLDSWHSTVPTIYIEDTDGTTEHAYCMSERWCEALETYPDGYEQPIVIGVDPDYGIVCEGDCFHLCCLLEDREDEIIREDIPF